MSSGYEEWDRIYSEYPLETLPWELGKPRKVLVDLVESGRIKKGKALDICCGAGTNALYLAKEGFQVTGIDVSSKAVEYPEENARKAGVGARFQVENFLNLPFEDQEFDFVFDLGCFHHVKVKDRTAFTGGVHRVLKKGGSYLVVCFSYKNGPAWNHFTRDQLVQIFSGPFKIRDIKHLSSVEGDGVVRYFYSVLLERK